MIDQIGKTQFWRLCWKLLQNFETFSLKLEKSIEYSFLSSFCSLKSFFFWTRGRKIWHLWQKIRLKSRAISAALPTKMIFLSQKQFLAKNFPWTRRMQFWWPFPFFARSPIIMSWKSETDGKKLSIRKNIFPPKVSSGAVAWKSLAQSQILRGIFFSTKEISPKHPSNFCWQSKKEEYDKYFEKRFSLTVSSGHERFSFNNPTEKVLAIHPNFLSPGMRGCEAQIPNRSFTKKPPFVHEEVVQFSFEIFSFKSVL